MDIRKVLVTGGAGCIGMQVCQQLKERGLKVRLFDLLEQVLRVREFIPVGVEISYGSVLEKSSVRDAIHGCDAVVHLAGYLGVRRTEQHRLRCLEINVEGTNHVLDYAAQHRLHKVVFASSSEVYGEPAVNPINEDAPLNAKSVYAVSKLAGEELCRAYNQRSPDMAYTILRYFNTYGPFQTAQFVIPRFVWNAIHDLPPVIFGQGNQLRAYCYASDVGRATVESLLRPEANGQVINVGDGSRPTSLLELADLVIDMAGKKGKLVPEMQPDFRNSDRQSVREIYRRVCDSTRAKKVLDFVPQVSLEDGIRQLMEPGRIFENWETTELPYLQEELT